MNDKKNITIANRPLLSICIPIYNRLFFLQKMLSRFMEDRVLFDDEIELIISDNCSTEDIQTCVESFRKKGLSIFYNKQETNLGPDGNFNYCFKKASGKYMWLLGSDDIPLSGVVRDVLNHLRDNDFGLFHFITSSDGNSFYKEYDDNNDMLVDINVQITFMSANIISTTNLASLNLLKYRGTNLIQVPAFIDACLSKTNNAIYKTPKIFEPIQDVEHTGDYNLFGVMVKNLFTICQEFVDAGSFSKKNFKRFRHAECRWLSDMVITYLILGRKNNYILKDAWRNLGKYYATDPYAYYVFISTCLSSVLNKILRFGTKKFK